MFTGPMDVTTLSDHKLRAYGLDEVYVLPFILSESVPLIFNCIEYSLDGFLLTQDR